MERLHFLNVNEGDCTWIQHFSGRDTIVDICNGNATEEESEEQTTLLEELAKATTIGGPQGNYNQAEHPTNPIEYFKQMGLGESVFRFILTHPDMDHLDGIKRLFSDYEVINFWDTDNNKTMDFSDQRGSGKYKEWDWEYYRIIRSDNKAPKVLQLLAGSEGEYYKNDGIDILSPTEELIVKANKTNDYNMSSYVLLFTTNYGKKVLLAGDSDEAAWDSIMENYSNNLQDIDVLIAPHHGRKTGGCSDYLYWLNPKITLFGNAKSKYLDYSSWNNRNLKHITNNQAGNIMVDFDEPYEAKVYVSNESFASSYVRKYGKCLKSKNVNGYTYYLIEEL